MSQFRRVFSTSNCPSRRLIGVQEIEDKVGYIDYNEIPNTTLCERSETTKDIVYGDKTDPSCRVLALQVRALLVLVARLVVCACLHVMEARMSIA